MSMKAMDTKYAKDAYQKINNHFPKAKIKVQDNGYKFTLKVLEHEDLALLAEVNKIYDVSIKRSGFGLAVFVLIY